MSNACQIPLIFQSRRSAARAKPSAPCQCLQNLPIVDRSTPYGSRRVAHRARPGEADIIIVGRADRPSSIVAPNLRTPIR